MRTLGSGLDRFDLLHSDRLWLIDATVTESQINAGWVYLDGGLREVETVGEFKIKIPPQIQSIDFPSEFYLSNDVIEFLRC